MFYLIAACIIFNHPPNSWTLASLPLSSSSSSSSSSSLSLSSSSSRQYSSFPSKFPPITDCSCTTVDILPQFEVKPTTVVNEHLTGVYFYRLSCARPTFITDIDNFCNSSQNIEFLQVVNIKSYFQSFSKLVNRLGISKLKLTYSFIEFSNKSTFHFFGNVTILDVSFSHISSLGNFEKFFRSVNKKLDLLDLSNNRISYIDGCLDELTNLTKLYIRHNKIVSVNETSFNKLTNLRYLYLDNNDIERVHEKSFESLNKLSYLVLTNNPIHHFDHVIFPSRFLSFLDLSECYISHLPLSILSSVRYLQLKKNKINFLEEMHEKESNMVILVLDNNSITGTTQHFFSKLPNLRQLWLNNNKLIYLPPNLPRQLQKLLLDGNSITSVDENGFPHGSELKTLSLSCNQIKQLEENTFAELNKLEYLDLSSNKITVIKKLTFDDLINLETVHLSNNPLHVVEAGVFDRAIKLKSLTISNVAQNLNLLQRNIFENLFNLEVLDLEGSPSLILNVMKSKLLSSDLKLLQVLNIAGSELTYISKSDLNKLKDIENVKISSNSWICNSSIISLKLWLLSSNGRFSSVNRNTNKCFLPERLEDRLIVSLKESDVEFDFFWAGQIKNNTVYHSLTIYEGQHSNENILINDNDIFQLEQKEKDSNIKKYKQTSPIADQVKTITEIQANYETATDINIILVILITSTITLGILVALVLGIQVMLNKRAMKNYHFNESWLQDKDTTLLSVSLNKNKQFSTSSYWEAAYNSPSVT